MKMRTWIMTLAATGLSVSVHAAEPQVWRQFVEAKRSGAEPVLPDFSYAGYRAGEAGIPDVKGPVFDVTQYGARPDDGGDDQDAIQAAIDAAEQAGGGVVQLPRGRYDVNTDFANRRPLRIRQSGIVLRGAGMGRGGTVLRIHQPTLALQPGLNLGMGGGFVQVGPDGPRAADELAKVVADSSRETHELVVDRPDSFTPGMWVSLRTRGIAAVSQAIAPYTIDDLGESWTRIRGDQFYRTEHHQILAIAGNRITLREPLKSAVSYEHGWTLTRYEPISEVGVEDICFVGGWLGKFSHHRSQLDDSGWAGLKFTHVADGWVRRCAFVNMNDCFGFEWCAYSSALQNILAGTMGHVSIGSPRRSTGMLIGLSKCIMERSGARDTSHGIGAAGSACGSVYWRYTMHPEESFDMHGMFPYATLFDCVVGGNFNGSGGPVASFPNHLERFVAWNFEHTSTPRYRTKGMYHFWAGAGARPNMVKPMFIGMHGAAVEVASESVGLNESQGQAVTPQSLYEAQLSLRLGRAPAWVGEARREWEKLSETALPQFERGGDNTPSVAAQREQHIRWILQTPVVKNRYREDDPLQGLIDEWPTSDGSPWPRMVKQVGAER